MSKKNLFMKKNLSEKFREYERIIISAYYLDKLRYMTKLIVTAVSADIFDFASDSARNRPVTYTRQE